MVRRLTLPLVFLAFAACGDEELPFFDAAALCANGGGPFNCSCPGGVTGTQTCEDDDTLSACDCPAVADAGTDPGADVGSDVSTDIELDTGVTTCADASECAEGEDCVGGICVEAPEPEYRYVAIVSDASGSDALGTNTPGPDFDAVQLVKGGGDNWAATVEQSGAGEVDPFEGNNNDDPSLVLGPNDAIPASDGSDECNLADAGDGGEFHSMGGDGGFVIVSFGTGVALEDGDTVNIWEVSDETCSNVSIVRPDAYSVYFGTDVSNVTTVADLGPDTGWVQGGNSGPNGGFTSLTVSLGE